MQPLGFNAWRVKFLQKWMPVEVSDLLNSIEGHGYLKQVPVCSLKLDLKKSQLHITVMALDRLTVQHHPKFRITVGRVQGQP